MKDDRSQRIDKPRALEPDELDEVSGGAIREIPVVKPPRINPKSVNKVEIFSEQDKGNTAD